MEKEVDMGTNNTYADNDMSNNDAQNEKEKVKEINGYKTSEIIKLAQSYKLLSKNAPDERKNEICNIIEQSIRETQSKRNARFIICKIMKLFLNELRKKTHFREIRISSSINKISLECELVEVVYNELCQSLLTSYSDDYLKQREYDNYTNLIDSENKSFPENMRILCDIESQLQARPDEYYTGDFCKSLKGKLASSDFLAKGYKFMKNKEAAFIYDLIHGLGIELLDKGNDNQTKKDHIKCEIAKFETWNRNRK